MHINCPHCHNGIEVVEEASLTDLACPSCNSRFSLVGNDPDLAADQYEPDQTVDHTSFDPNQTCDIEGTLTRSDESQNRTGTGTTRPTKTMGRFELINEVGKGAFGSVWRGKDPKLDRTVAVKIPRKGQLSVKESEQFFREARAAAQLKHPNIVPVHEIGKDGETIYIVSDFVKGVSLADRLDDGPMDERTSAELCIKIAKALAHAHDKGVVHRDLKPANIMLDDDGEPFVMDFGLAKRDAGEITMTVDGQILGTPAYMSPEQASGDSHSSDGRTDVYSIGVILFKMLTGELPFRGNMQMLIHQVINEEAPSPAKLNSGIDRDLATITVKCMEKDPDKRYADAESLADDLQSYLDGKPIKARPVSNIERGWRWCKRSPALAGTMATSLLLLTALAIGGPVAASYQASLRSQAEQAKNKADAASKKFQKEAETNAQMLGIITDAFRSVNPDKGANAEMSAKDVLFQARDALNQSELKDLSKAKMLEPLTTSFLEIGEFNSAISAAEEALTLRQDILGPDHPDTLTSMSNLASCFDVAGRTKEGIPLHEKTLHLKQINLGPNHPDTLATMGNLASSYEAAGRTDDAVRWGEKTLELMQMKLGFDHLSTLKVMGNLPVSYKNAGRTDDAIQLNEKTLAMKKKILGPNDPNMLNSLVNVADNYRAVGRTNEAILLYEKTLPLMKKKLGPDHPSTLTATTNLASGYMDAGRTDDAIRLNKKMLDTMQTKLGPDHPSTLATTTNLATIYRTVGRTEESLQMLDEAIALMQKKLEPEHVLTKFAVSNLGLAIEQMGVQGKKQLSLHDFAGAQASFDLMLKHHGPYEIRLIPQHLHLALLGQRKWEEGLKVLSDWEAQLASLSKKTDATINLQDLLTMRSPNETAKLLAWINTSRAVCQLELGKHDEAEKSARKALANENITGSNRHRANSVLAVCLAHQNEFQTATKKAIESFEGLDSMFEIAPQSLLWYIPRAAERVVKVYELANEPDKVKKWNKKLAEAESKIDEFIQSRINKISKVLAEAYNNQIWPKVAKPSPTSPFITLEELNKYRQVCEEYPQGIYFNTLAVAEYRMANYKESIAAALKSVELTPKEAGLPSPHPSDYAFIAMSHFKLGDKEKANEYRVKLNEAMKLNAFKNDEECLSFVQEVKSLLDD